MMTSITGSRMEKLGGISPVLVFLALLATKNLGEFSSVLHVIALCYTPVACAKTAVLLRTNNESIGNIPH